MLFLKLRFLRNILIIFALAIPFLIIGYFFFSKGPADLQAVIFAGQALREKYGPIKDHESVGVLSYSFDPQMNANTGIYYVRFTQDDHHGKVKCAYDKSSGKFTVISVEEEK